MLIKTKFLFIGAIAALCVFAAVIFQKDGFLKVDGTSVAGGTSPANATKGVSAAVDRDLESRARLSRNPKQKKFDFQKSQEIPDGDVTALIDQYKRSAIEGDGAASRAIYLLIERCRAAATASLAPRTYVQPMDKALLTRGEDEASAKNRLEMVRLRNIEKSALGCENLPPEIYQSAGDWLTRAAEQGDTLAQLVYASRSDLILGKEREMLSDPDATKAYKERALRFLQSAVASSGSPEALQALSNAYQVGAIANRDPVLAYSYRLVANRVAPDPQGTQVLSHLEKGLNSKQVGEAREKANKIFENCCF